MISESEMRKDSSINLSEESPKFFSESGIQQVEDQYSCFDSSQQLSINNQNTRPQQQSDLLVMSNHTIPEEEDIQQSPMRINHRVQNIFNEPDLTYYFDQIISQKQAELSLLERCISAPLTSQQQNQDRESKKLIKNLNPASPSKKVRMPDMPHLQQFSNMNEINSNDDSLPVNSIQNERIEENSGDFPNNNGMSFTLNGISIHQSIYQKSWSANHSCQNILYHSDELIVLIKEYLEKLSYYEYVNQSPKSFINDTTSLKIAQFEEIGKQNEMMMINETKQKILRRTFEQFFSVHDFIGLSPIHGNKNYFKFDNVVQNVTIDQVIKINQEINTGDKQLQDAINELVRQIDTLKQEVEVWQTKCNIGDCRMMDFYDNEQKAKVRDQILKKQIQELQNENEKTKQINASLLIQVQEKLKDFSVQQKQIDALKIINVALQQKSKQLIRQKYQKFSYCKEELMKEQQCSTVFNIKNYQQQMAQHKIAQSRNQNNFNKQSEKILVQPEFQFSSPQRQINAKIQQIQASSSISLSPSKVSQKKLIEQNNPTYAQFVSLRAQLKLNDMKQINEDPNLQHIMTKNNSIKSVSPKQSQRKKVIQSLTHIEIEQICARSQQDINAFKKLIYKQDRTQSLEGDNTEVTLDSQMHELKQYTSSQQLNRKQELWINKKYGGIKSSPQRNLLTQSIQNDKVHIQCGYEANKTKDMNTSKEILIDSFKNLINHADLESENFIPYTDNYLDQKNRKQ